MTSAAALIGIRWGVLFPLAENFRPYRDTTTERGATWYRGTRFQIDEMAALSGCDVLALYRSEEEAAAHAERINREIDAEYPDRLQAGAKA